MDTYQAPPRHHNRPRATQPDKTLRLRNALNIIFILLALLTVIIYFVKPLPEGLPYFFTCCFAALLVKTVEVFIRMARNKKQRHDKRTDYTA